MGLDLRAWIANCDPSALTATGDSWIAFGQKLENLFDKYVNAVTTVDGAYWQGQTADAAHERATADQKTMRTLVDKLGAVANRAKQGYDEINAPLLRARGALLEASACGYTVGPDLAVSIPAGKQVSDADKKQMLDVQAELHDAAKAIAAADQKVRDDLNKAKADLRVSFISGAALGADIGRKDGADLAKDPSHMTPEEIQRLIDAGRLTPTQIASLQAGNTTTIPAAQMEYLNTIGRSLDGKSPQEIQQIMDKLPPDAQKSLANSFQIMSNPNIQTAAAANDKDLPNNGKGEFSLLPKKMQDSLTRKDLVTTDHNVFQYSPTEDPLSVGINTKTIHLNGVADNQAIAKLVGSGDASYRVGSDVDKHVLDVGAQYLHGQATYDASKGGMDIKVDGEHPFGGQPVSEPMFSSVGDDKQVVKDMVTGPNGNQFMHDVTTHPWTGDNGAAAANLFKFGDHDAVPTDPNNPAQVAVANREGTIMSTVGKYLSSDDTVSQLSNMGNNQSFGQVNSSLAQTMAHSMTPYVDLVAQGTHDPQHNYGFDAQWATDDSHNMKGAKNAFEILDTNKDAQNELSAASERFAVANEVAYAHDPNSPNSVHHLLDAGRLTGINDSALRDANMINGMDQHSADIAAYNQKKAAYESISKLGEIGLDKIPGSDAVLGDVNKNIDKVLGFGGDSLKSSILGDDPSTHPVNPTQINAHDFEKQDWAVMSNANIAPELKAQYPELFDTNGNMRSWNDLNSSGTQLPDQVYEIFNKFGVSNDGHGGAMAEAYRPIVETDVSNPPGKK
jgi:hypothetical protein